MSEGPPSVRTVRGPTVPPGGRPEGAGPAGGELALPSRPLSHHLALTVYWFSNTLLWGALLHLGLQSRLGDWFPQERVGYYLGLVGLVGGTCGAVAQFVVGALSDHSRHRWGRRRPFLLAGALGCGLALLGLGAANSFWPFAAAFVFTQLTSNIALAPFAALLPDTVPAREHGTASGMMGLARLLGDIGGLVLAASLLSTAALPLASPATVTAFHAQRMTILSTILAGALIVAAIVTCLSVREVPLRGASPVAWREVIAGAFALDRRTNADFAWLTLSRGVTNLGFYMFLAILLYFVKYTLGAPDPEGMTRRILVPAMVVAALVTVPAGVVSDRVGRRGIIFAAQLTLAGAAAALLIAPTARVALFAGIPAGIAYGVFTSVEWALACNLLPPREAARHLAVWNAAAVIPQVLAFPVAGVVGSALAGYGQGIGWRVDFAIAILCCLVGAWLLRRVREPRAA